jgi:uncharacterized protein GlcG (DUF336 family)
MTKSQKKRTARRLGFEGLESRMALSGDTISTSDVAQLLERATAAATTQDAIIAVVDRGGHILGVRTEAHINTANTSYLVFSIDGAVAEARTAAFFSSDAAPLTSRTVRYISQSTITQREVQANPNSANPTINGPGFVAPIGVGGQFPPGITSTPLVDLFAIEHTNRVNDNIPGISQASYGVQSGIMPSAQARGIGTLPGGIPLYKNGTLVGGIGVFFPGPNGYAAYEQGFIPNIGQTSVQRTNAPLELEAEWMAFAATNGSSGAGASVGTLSGIPPVPGYNLPGGPAARIDLAGITLQSVGPIAGPSGIQTILNVGRTVGPGPANGPGIVDQPIDPGMDQNAAGTTVAAGWLIPAHAGSSLTQADVTQIVVQAVLQARVTRAQIRPLGSTTKMVIAVSDKDGSLLGVYRMLDATIFSVDVAIAKARNMAYYDDPAQVQTIDLVDDNRDNVPDLPAGVAFTNRTVRFLAAPNYPSGALHSVPGAFSILRDPGINPSTAENVGPPQPASVYQSVLGFDSFNPGRNFHDPNNLANQNGVVFFPGSSALYKQNVISGGLGVSGDGVDQDDVVTFYGAQGFQAPTALRADQFFVRNVRLPYQNFSRNATGI